MLQSGSLTDVVLSAGGASLRAHRLVLAACSAYFAQLFKEVETDSALVVVLNCESSELELLLTFMYTGEVTASREVLPSLLRLAQTLKVSGLTDADTNSTVTTTEEPQEDQNVPMNLELNKDATNTNDSNCQLLNDVTPLNDAKDHNYTVSNDLMKTEKDRLSKLDQIVQNLYSTHKVGNPSITSPLTPPIPIIPDNDYRKWRGSVCTVCNKRLSNQYNLRVHMETHAGRRHACRACAHVSRSRDALRKHVAYRHAHC